MHLIGRFAYFITYLIPQMSEYIRNGSEGPNSPSVNFGDSIYIEGQTS